MIIILYGDKNDTVLGKLLIRNLSEKYNINYINYKSAVTYDKLTNKDKIFIIENDSICDFSLDKCIIVLKNNITDFQIKNFKANENTIMVFNSDDDKHIRLVANKSVPAISCGLSEKDTFNFSSINTDSAVISLQRSIKNIKHNLCEAMDILVRFNEKIDNYYLLSYVAVLTSIGYITNEENQDIFIHLHD